jgi:hypothetical protein
MPHRRAVLALAAALCFGLASCGSNSSSSSSSSSSTSTTAAKGSSTTSAPTTSAHKSGSHCSTDQLKASLGETQSGAGQRYTVLILTNTGTKTCELRGFPGVSLLDAAGKQLGEPASREGSEGPTVSIAPGASASTTLHTSAQGLGAACEPTSTQLRVYPPDNTAALNFPAAYSACGGFRVSTLVAGTSGN